MGQTQRHQLGVGELALELAAVLVVMLLRRLQLPREERLDLLLVSAGTDRTTRWSGRPVYPLQTLKSRNGGQVGILYASFRAPSFGRVPIATWSPYALTPLLGNLGRYFQIFNYYLFCFSLRFSLVQVSEGDKHARHLKSEKSYICSIGIQVCIVRCLLKTFTQKLHILSAIKHLPFLDLKRLA